MRQRERREKRALSNVGGRVETEGHEELTPILARAMSAVSDEVADSFTHPFHTYPARMHPGIARTIIAELTGPGSMVLDPFCGSGTVIVEARLAGRSSIGSDLSPVAIELTRVKSERVRPKERDRFLLLLERIAQRSEDRVRGRVDARAPVSREIAARFDGHVLKELAGLREEILAIEDRELRRSGLVLLSSIVVKVSRQESDTAEREADKRVRKGLPTELFVRKGRELVGRWASYDDALPPGAPRPSLHVCDARDLTRVMAANHPSVRADLVLCSPPYGGVYDYVAHHALRYAFLGIDPAPLARDEIGARRNLRTAESGMKRWDRELGEALRAIARCVDREGFVVLLIGDAQIGGEIVAAERQIVRLAGNVGLEAIGRATQSRGEGKREHLIALAPA